MASAVTDKQATVLQEQLTEYFQAFAFVGFDYLGNRVTMRHQESPMHRDACVQFMRDWIDIVYDGPVEVRVTDEEEED